MKKYLRNDLILIFLITISASLIISFVNFKDDTKNKEYHVNVYKAYYVYDELSTPKSLSYKMLNMAKDASKESIITKVIEELFKENHHIQIEKIDLKNNIITLSGDPASLTNTERDCLVNSLTGITAEKSLNIKYLDQITKYYPNLDDYYIISPINNKLYTFMYRDNNYDIVYLNQNKEENLLKIKTNKEKEVIYLFGNQEYRLSLRKDGLYLNQEKILSSTYKVGDTWGEYQISKVYLSESDERVIEVIKEEKDTKKLYILKQGIGLYQYEEKVNNRLNKKYIYQSKRLNEGKND